MNFLKGWRALWTIIAILLITIGVLASALFKTRRAAVVNSFEACEAAGYLVGESYPRQCFTPYRSFIEDISSPTDSDNTVCTMEARQCPDGSWVGRTGPNCEFTLCP